MAICEGQQWRRRGHANLNLTAACVIEDCVHCVGIPRLGVRWVRLYVGVVIKVLQPLYSLAGQHQFFLEQTFSPRELVTVTPGVRFYHVLIG